MKPKTPYQAFLIRLWPASRQGRVDCRVLLEEVASQERREFADLDSLFEYLRSQCDLFVALRAAGEGIESQ